MFLIQYSTLFIINLASPQVQGSADPVMEPGENVVELGRGPEERKDGFFAFESEMALNDMFRQPHLPSRGE